MRQYFFVMLLLVACVFCSKSEATEIFPKMFPERTQRTYFYNYMFEGRQSLKEIFDLSEEEIGILKIMAANGDGVAGARLYQYYFHTAQKPEYAEDAVEMVPRGSGIGEYYIASFRHNMPSQFYLQRKQVVQLVSLAASGNREAAKRVGEYYSADFRNETLAYVFMKFAQGDDSQLPKIQKLDAEFQVGHLESIRNFAPSAAKRLMDEFSKSMRK